MYGRVKTRLCKTGPCKNYYVHRLAYMMHSHTFIRIKKKSILTDSDSSDSEINDFKPYFMDSSDE